MEHKSARALLGRSFALAAVLLLLAGCGGIQSALDPSGEEAERISILFYAMCIGGVVIYVVVMSLLVYATRANSDVVSEKTAGRLILFGTLGTVAVLFVLLSGSMWLWSGLRPSGLGGEAGGQATDRLEIAVTGEQFWWRVTYRTPGGPAIAVDANEIRLPVGQHVNFVLDSADMIHSFWIPSLGGKMDMIPGRTNHLSLRATKPGTYRGVCAEFCGSAHALMAFAAVAMEPAEFQSWLNARAEPAETAQGEGLQAFLRQGCGACHAIDGTPADGLVGPNLSHVGSRETIGAGILPNTVASIASFIREPDRLKPGVMMPSYDMLPEREIMAIATYLKGLQ